MVVFDDVPQSSGDGDLPGVAAQIILKQDGICKSNMISVSHSNQSGKVYINILKLDLGGQIISKTLLMETASHSLIAYDGTIGDN